MTSGPNETTHALPTIAERRKRLKQNLFRSRVINGDKPICCICGKPVSTGGEMHEVFLTRGDAQKMDDFLTRQIYDPCNCVILCSQACHIEAATESGKLLCAAKLLLHEGFINMDNFLNRQSKFWKGAQPEIERRYIRDVMDRINVVTDEDESLKLFFAHIHPGSIDNAHRWQAADFK